MGNRLFLDSDKFHTFFADHRGGGGLQASLAGPSGIDGLVG